MRGENMLKAVLVRIHENDKQTLGNFILFDGTDIVFSCKSLELPNHGNAEWISCIPPGDYICRRQHSTKFGNHFAVRNRQGGEVPCRKFILIHKGNFHRDIQGCILLGRDHVDIDLDGYKDVTSSAATMNQLNNSVNDLRFDFRITDMTRGFNV
jgi:hypothetical protein